MRKLTQKEYEERFYSIYDSEKFKIVSPYISRREYLTIEHVSSGNKYTKKAYEWLKLKNFEDYCEFRGSQGNKVSQDEYEKRFYDIYGDKFTLESKYTSMHDNILIKHNACGSTFERRALNALNGKITCPCESAKDFVTEINSIAIKDPDFAKLFLNKNDTYKYSCGSTQKSDFVCPECGKIIKNKQILSVYKQGLFCPVCGKKASLGERIMYQLLYMFNEKLDCSFDYDKTYNWSCSKRYDFLFKLNGITYIVETHGNQHYSSTQQFKNSTLSSQKSNDLYKYNLAIDNNIVEPDNYIVIDCRKSDIDYIKNNILDSKLDELFNLVDFDWELCFLESATPTLKMVCDAWNKGFNTYDELTNELHMHYQTIQKYLSQGRKLGMCDYTRIKRKKVNSDSNISIQTTNNKLEFGKEADDDFI
ncbi:hypothetical protein FYJ37_00925 [[Clostridium] scindens]|uniref:Uncharacterized protein n=1 Tax=Clostridium scindens (strain JCM 10418 / VPI 12708) TaxID=29347 RepID=A0A844F775_CLOSV|nr:hypothetical protein [[Clostridium] scindens]MSS38947.1 hypothetical protein [[Clostridium] scindens]